MPNPRSTAKKVRRGVFISYARSDGEAFAARLRARLEQERIPLWQDRQGLEGGRDWWLQITEALDSVEFVALVMTPDALNSDIVRKEWRYARQEGVCVYPVKGAPDLDFKIMPRWMRDAHFYDLGEVKWRDGPEWTKFVNDLRGGCQARRVPFMIEDLPDDFVPRPKEFEQLLGHLLDRQREEPVAITAALRGAGGFGKTTLARALCHDERVQEAFNEGILWVTLGEHPGDLTGRVEDLIYTLSDERTGFTDINAATARLVELLADRDVLIVIDDVWNSAHLRPFTQGGPRCARLITTRNFDTLPARAQRVDVDAMRQDEAVALVGAGLPGGSEADLRALADRLGEWPLLLTLVNGALRQRVDAGQPLPAALAYVNTALDRRGLTYFDARDSPAREQAVAKTLGVSFEHLKGNELARYGELAVFPEDAVVPLATIEKFWGATGGLDAFDTEDLCDRLGRLSLLLHFDPTTRYVRLHDIIRKYLIQELGNSLPAIQSKLLDAHRPAGAGWANMQPAEPYFWDQLAYHLKEAERGDELQATVKDLNYLAAKTFVRKSSATERDLLAAEELYPQDAALSLLRRSFTQAGHLLDRCLTLDDVKGNLFRRVLPVEEPSGLTQNFARTLTSPRLVPFRALPDIPSTGMVRTLTGRGGGMDTCAFGPGGSTIVAGANDGTLTVWDAKDGQEYGRVKAHALMVHGCDVSSDGSLIVSASEDTTVKVWDARTGGVKFNITAHKKVVNDCVFSPDGSFIVTASRDETLKVWDATTGRERLTLAGHSGDVTACAVSRDGSLIVSASRDQTLKVWDAATGRVRLTIPVRAEWASSCAISPDGSLLASADSNHMLQLWDARSGQKLFELKGHTGGVWDCAFSPDGSLLASASADGLVKLWDLNECRESSTFAGHSSTVWSCVFSPDGSVIASSSSDGTVRLWDVKSGGKSQTTARSLGAKNCCAIHPDGLFAAYGSGNDLRVREVASGREMALAGHRDIVHDCAYSPDGTFIVSASGDKTGKIWRAGAECLTLRGHSAWVYGCAVSPDARLVATASCDGTLKIWDAKGGRELHTFAAHQDNVSDCAFSPDGSFIVSASWDGTLCLWDLRERTKRLTLTGHQLFVFRCAVSPDGSFIVSTSNDGSAKVWDARSGRELRSLTGHQDAISGCAISPDGSVVITSSWDQTLKVWETETGRCLFTFQAEGKLTDCQFFGDGRLIAATGESGLFLLKLEG